MTLMTFVKQSNGRRTAVESKSNLSFNHSVYRIWWPWFKSFLSWHAKRRI